MTEDLKTDEEKGEELKQWWSENGTSVIAGVAIAIAGLFGWDYWKEQQLKETEEASGSFSQLQSTSANDGVQALTELRDNYSSTPYSASAALLSAKLLSGEGKNEEAIAQLEWVSKNAPNKALKDVAKIRTARTLVNIGKFDEALSILNQQYPTAYLSLIEEIRGDIHTAKNNLDEARKAYDKALLSADGSSTEYLKMKRDVLGKGT